MRTHDHCHKRLHSGFSLIEVLVALAISVIIMSFLFELLIANQRVLTIQRALSTLETRIQRIASIFRSEIHRAEGLTMLGDNQLTVSYQNAEGSTIKNSYLIEKDKLVMINNNRTIKLVENVREMKLVRIKNGIDVSMYVSENTIGKRIHVFTAL